jgi:hypothetical protein
MTRLLQVLSFCYFWILVGDMAEDESAHYYYNGTLNLESRPLIHVCTVLYY